MSKDQEINHKKKKRIPIKGRKANQDVIASLSLQLADQMPLQRSRLIEYLHVIQDSHGFIDADHMVALAKLMNIAYTEVYEVASFYHHFDLVKKDEDKPKPLTIRVCDSVSCELAGSEQLIKDLKHKYSDVRIQPVPCVGRCDCAPIAVVGQNPVKSATIERVDAAVSQQQISEPMPSHTIQYDEYVKQGGYTIYNDVLSGKLGHDSVISILDDSGLRGLGGAGFPAGRKWKIVRGFEAPRIMAVNIDEGEPGTFKDRHYIEQNPHQFVEGLLIAAQVVGTSQVYIYIRDEYPACRHLIQQALDHIKQQGFELPEIEVRRGAGAYICGEESAMIESIEGKRGMPRLRPPFVAEIGVFNRPTLEHNFETLFWVPTLIEKGAKWFASHGRNGRQGLRSYSVSGRVKKPGVHLAPAGISIKELIEEYCDGMLDGHELYAYFPGGASGGILPASMDDVPLDFDTLNQYGCFIGSAAVIVLSDKDSVKQAALNAMRFFKHESCGKCTPCRVGTTKVVQLMENKTWDLDLIKELTTVMMDASICGLGQAAPNPLLSLIKYFPHEIRDEVSAEVVV